MGATYTPQRIVAEMVRWARATRTPERVVDPGVGSGRYLRRAAAAFPEAQLLGVDVDPLAALLARASLATAGLADRAAIEAIDYRELVLPEIGGPTLFIGNPPYVRHHQIDSKWKRWLSATAAMHGYNASQLAGLHVHFYLATAGLARPGDLGTFITSSEWLDVNYGRLVRELFLGRLGGTSLVVIDPAARPFPDAATTAVITTFETDKKPSSLRVRRAETTEDVGPVGSGATIRRERFEAENRWSHILRAPPDVPEGYIELGEICRVHRGQVTGANKVWIAEMNEAASHLPETVLYRSVTRGRELIKAGAFLRDSGHLRHVIDLPVDLDVLDSAERRAVEKFLRWAKRRGAHEGYVARHRSAWWSVGLREAPPILSTYMARRPPTFVRNKVGARYINIAHGIYPREPMTQRALDRLRTFLAGAAEEARGRVYAGGLQKFEPRELERIPIPQLALLQDKS